jgi:UDP:flavonoid glycosyltransferase YjiC (YdhE family)
MVVFPQDADQPFNAKRVEELGLGVCMQTNEIAGHLYTTSSEIIKDKGDRYANIQYAKKQLRNAGGIVKAADLVERGPWMNS